MNTIKGIQHSVLNDLHVINEALVWLARHEHKATANTLVADQATKAMNRIAVTIGVSVERGEG